MASTKQRRPDHPASLGDFVTSSTRTRFSVHTGEAYAVIDGTDGRAHHVRFRVKPSRRAFTIPRSQQSDA
jgi:hypothetical protein